MTIEWKDSYKIGNAEIDKQHEYLFELTNKMTAVDSMTALRPLIMLLFKHTREHFELEEALMRKHNMPDLDAHVDNHNKLLNRLSLLSMDVGKGHMNKRAIAELMADWALNHVTNDDAKISAYLLSSPSE